MPALSSLAPAVLLLAPQAAAPAAAATAAAASAAAAPGVSVQQSPARVLAASTISSALLEMKPEPTGAAKEALEYLDSKNFQSSDPELKLVLADVIRYDGEGFNRIFEIERAKDPKLSFQEVLGEAIERTILKHRDFFSPGEIVLGMRFEDGSSKIVSIPAIGARTTVQSELIDRYESAKAADEAAAAESRKAGRPHVELAELTEAGRALGDWTRSWTIGFGFADSAP